MAGPAAVIAKEVRKEICRNNKPSEKKKNPSTAAATQSAQRGPVKRNQSTLWNPLFLADHRRLLQLRESKIALELLFCFDVVHLAKTEFFCSKLTVPASPRLGL